MKGNHTPLREVQQTLLSFISANTILIGHSLETDLCALKVTTKAFCNIAGFVIGGRFVWTMEHLFVQFRLNCLMHVILYCSSLNRWVYTRLTSTKPHMQTNKAQISSCANKMAQLKCKFGLSRFYQYYISSKLPNAKSFSCLPLYYSCYTGRWWTHQWSSHTA